jgi:hypothetical protein
LIPEEFKSTEVKTTVKISKKEILDAMKDGRSVPGAYVTRSCRLVTKPSQLKEIPKAKPIAEKLRR